jgi:hypothetical protein
MVTKARRKITKSKTTRKTKKVVRRTHKQHGGFQDLYSAAAYISEPGMSVKGAGDVPGLSIPGRKALIRSGSASCSPGSHP